MVKKFALLIGVSNYQGGLSALPTAVSDVNNMHRVLENPQIAGFDGVKLLLEPSLEEMRVHIHSLFANCQKNDLVLLFFSGHGIIDNFEQLYLATPPTQPNAFKATAISANYIKDMMRDSPSRRQIVILDCCYSGAFARNWQVKPNCDIALLASSSPSQMSYEAEETGIYTHCLVEGMETGAADRDNDGEVLIAELHNYAKKKVQEFRPQMKPYIQAFQEGFQIAIAKSQASQTPAAYGFKNPAKTVIAPKTENWRCAYTLNQHSDAVKCIAISADGQTLVSGSADCTIKIWNVNTGAQLGTLEGHTDAVNCLAIAGDGKTLASGSSDQTIQIWNLPTEKQIRKIGGLFPAHLDSINSLAIAPDGKTLISGSRDHTIKVWDLARGREINKLSQHSWGVYSVAFTPDGQAIASDCLDHTIKLCRWDTQELLQNFTGHSDWIWAIAISPNGKILASGSEDCTVKLWNLETGKLLHTLTEHNSPVHAVSFSFDGQTLASGSYDHTIKLWNVGNWQLIHTLTGHLNGVNSLAFSPDNRIIVSASDDRTIKIWRVAVDS